MIECKKSHARYISFLLELGPLIQLNCVLKARSILDEERALLSQFMGQIPSLSFTLKFCGVLMASDIS